MKKIILMLCAVSLSTLLYAPIYQNRNQIIYKIFSDESFLKRQALHDNEKLSPLTEVLLDQLKCLSEKDFNDLVTKFATTGLRVDESKPIFLYFESCYLHKKYAHEAHSTIKDKYPKSWIVIHVCHKILEDLGVNFEKRAKEINLFYHGFLNFSENLEKTRKELEEFDKDLEQPVKSWDSEDLTKEEK